MAAAARNSKGISQYKRDKEELIERFKRGEINFSECDEGIFAALLRGMLNMSKKELKIMQIRSLAVHGVLANELAKRGHPIPGNDPNKPS